MLRWYKSASQCSYHKRQQIPIRFRPRQWICWISCGNRANKLKTMKLEIAQTPALREGSLQILSFLKKVCVKSIKISWKLSVNSCFQFTWSNSLKLVSTLMRHWISSKDAVVVPNVVQSHLKKWSIRLKNHMERHLLFLTSGNFSLLFQISTLTVGRSVVDLIYINLWSISKMIKTRQRWENFLSSVKWLSKRN